MSPNEYDLTCHSENDKPDLVKRSKSHRQYSQYTKQRKQKYLTFIHLWDAQLVHL